MPATSSTATNLSSNHSLKNIVRRRHIHHYHHHLLLRQSSTALSRKYTVRKIKTSKHNDNTHTTTYT